MRFSTMRLATECTALLACTACGGGGPRTNDWAADAGARIQLLARVGGGEQSAPTRADSADTPATVRIALTGLILMMPPPEGQAGPTQLFMPVAGHAAYVAFSKADRSGCTYYNDKFNICFVNLDNSQLAPLGSAISASAHGIPTGVVNVSHGSGHKADTTDINGRITARATLLAGKATDSCSLASWSWGPVGQSIELPSVLTWEMPAPEGDSLVLIRQPLSGAVPAERRFVLHADSGRIDLLILHLTSREFDLLRTAERGSGTAAAPTLVNWRAERELRDHFTMLYNMIRAPASPRPFPTAPLETGHACPIPVLGLQNAAYAEPVWIGGRTAYGLDVGVRTFSCVMALAEGD